MSRFKSKVKDSNSQEIYLKLLSLIDFHNKHAQSFKEVNKYISLYNYYWSNLIKIS